MTEKTLQSKLIHLSPEVLKALRYQAVDAGMSLKAFIESLCIKATVKTNIENL